MHFNGSQTCIQCYNMQKSFEKPFSIKWIHHNVKCSDIETQKERDKIRMNNSNCLFVHGKSLSVYKMF